MIPSLRQRVAAMLPSTLRKAYRMTENYLKRQRLWTHVYREFQPVDEQSRAVLRRSLARGPFTAFARLDGFQPPRLLDDIDVSIAGVGQFHIRAKTDDILHVLSAREPKIKELVETAVPVGGTFVDAGANIGFYTVLAASRVGTAGSVIAFEMMPDTAEILRCHVSRNALAQVTVVEEALSNVAGQRIKASVEPGVHGQASIVAPGEGRRQTIVEVETTTLDKALAAVGQIDLMKLDLEGAELLALQGGSATLAKTACIVFENNAEDELIFELLEKAGFAIERLEGHDFVARRRVENGSPTRRGN